MIERFIADIQQDMGLTKGQTQLMKYLVTELNYAEIAEKVGRRAKSIENMASEIFYRLELDDREALRWLWTCWMHKVSLSDKRQKQAVTWCLESIWEVRE